MTETDAAQQHPDAPRHPLHPARSVGEVVELEVGAPGHGGFCVARLDGQAVFVRHALPGERVRARVTEVRPSYLRADAVEVLAPSADRVPPPCPHAGPGKCGGCDWQHVALPAQRELKAKVISEQFRRLAGMDVTVVVEEAPGSPDGLGWRTRVGFAVDRAGHAGLRRHRSHDVHPVATCLIAHPQIRALAVTGLDWRGAGSVEAIVSATGERALVVEARRGERITPSHPDESVAVARRSGKDLVVYSGAASVTEHAAGRDWTVGLDSFWQIHPAAADTLVAAVRGFAAVRADDRVLDLYAGVGLFAGALAAQLAGQLGSGRVVAVESSASAVRDAEVNLGAGTDLGSHVDIRRGVVEAGVVTAIAAELGAVDVVVLDPPRTGAGRAVVEDIAAVRPRAVVYVACDPAALARDVAIFDSLGYAVERLRAFDLFPMTAHVECVALLVRKDFRDGA
ncbi:MAG: rRNA (uracil-5-)-methyltransferase [Frankiales bacterium]|nr:rRNA (uracil-5-)-methyltransferase [Frankiales bacterium]